MAHCYICDFSETVRSDVYTSLHGVDPQGNKVLYDEKVDKYVCSDCIGVSLANYRALMNYKPPKKEAGEVEFELETADEAPWDLDTLGDNQGRSLPLPSGGGSPDVEF